MFGRRDDDERGCDFGRANLPIHGSAPPRRGASGSGTRFKLREMLTGISPLPMKQRHDRD